MSKDIPKNIDEYQTFKPRPKVSITINGVNPNTVPVLTSLLAKVAMEYQRDYKGPKRRGRGIVRLCEHWIKEINEGTERACRVHQLFVHERKLQATRDWKRKTRVRALDEMMNVPDYSKYYTSPEELMMEEEEENEQEG